MTARTPVARNEPIGSDNLERIGSDNPSIPQGYCDALTLQSFAQQALNGSGNKSSEPLTMPEPEQFYKRGRTFVDHNGKVGRSPDGSYWRAIWEHLQRWGFRTLNYLHRAGYAPPAQDDLAETFAAYVMSHAVLHDDISTRYAGAGGSLGLSTVPDLAALAAEVTLRDWEPSYNDAQAARSAKGGTKSKRRPEWVKDPSLLDKLAKHDGQTIPQQATAMGVSPSTIKRMRADLPEHLRRAADLSRELDQLFSEIA